MPKRKWLITFSWEIPGFGGSREQRVYQGINALAAECKLRRALKKHYSDSIRCTIEKIEEVKEWSR